MTDDHMGDAVPQWSYLGYTDPQHPAGGHVDVVQDPKDAFRREWWYDPGNTYVYQTRKPDGTWSHALGEYEECDSVPYWVVAALVCHGIKCNPAQVWVLLEEPRK